MEFTIQQVIDSLRVCTCGERCGRCHFNVYKLSDSTVCIEELMAVAANTLEKLTVAPQENSSEEPKTESTLKVYIAGNISTNSDYMLDFQNATIELLKKGYTPFNPVKVLGFDYKDYIDMGLAELSKCDAIYLLKGYENSKGAMLEKHYAESVGLKIMYQEDA